MEIYIFHLNSNKSKYKSKEKNIEHKKRIMVFSKRPKKVFSRYLLKSYIVTLFYILLYCYTFYIFQINNQSDTYIRFLEGHMAPVRLINN